MTQEDLDILKQQNRELSVVIKLMNKDYQLLEEISGEVISYDFSIDSTSDIRRTCSLSLYPKGTYDIANNGNIWFNRYVNINVGIKNNKTKEIVYYNMGTYLIDEPNYEYSADTNTLSIKCLDLMCVLTELRGGVLQGFGGKISATDSVRQWIIDLLALKGFVNYNIVGISSTETLPTGEDLTFDVGATVYSVLSAIIDLYPNYQMFFDADSVFNFMPIPTGNNEQIIASKEVWDNTLISISNAPIFSDVKNSVEVFGKIHDITYYCANPTLTISPTYISINITIDDFQSSSDITNGTMVGFTIPSDFSCDNVFLNFITPIGQSLMGVPLRSNENWSVQQPIYGSYSTYVVITMRRTADFDIATYMGSKQPYSLLQITNPSHPFSIGKIGTVHRVCSGGIYDNITNDGLALERAKWELYTSSLLQASLGLSCVPIYWLDVNKVIEVPIIDEKGITSLIKCIIKNISISGGVTGTMSISAMKYYPYYYS